ncbi:hypothetical protein TNCV_1152151 [Trichonephila clavipes]|nr:hypothetical protein TNCV_1152151 [Trichonephila clavipes]
MFRSGSHPHVKPPVFSSLASLVPIYEALKVHVDIDQPQGLNPGPVIRVGALSYPKRHNFKLPETLSGDEERLFSVNEITDLHKSRVENYLLPLKPLKVSCMVFSLPARGLLGN